MNNLPSSENFLPSDNLSSSSQSLNVQALSILQNTFGYQAFRGQQADIINQAISGQDILVLMPTGGGKSLCYQIPALVRSGVGVVISPLIALMQDQVNALAQLGVNACFLNSTLSYDQVHHIETSLISGEIDILYIAPERLIQPRTLSLLSQLPISLFAIDEAHCVSQWGHDFRSDYLNLSVLHEQFPSVPRMALTATADERTKQEIINRLQLHQAKKYISGFDRPNIQYRIGQKGNVKKQLVNFIKQNHQNDSGIVYCLSRKRVDSFAEHLSQQGFTALPYHAGLSTDIRKVNQDRFLREDNIIIVATIAFGMGIDKPDVRFVAHIDLPKSIEAYYQETGRAGRDGSYSTAWMIYGLQDVMFLTQMMQDSQGSEQFKRSERNKLDAMLGLCEVTGCRRKVLLNYFNEQAPEKCGNCDNCITPVETWDASVAAQKALSTVYRSGQRFGVVHLMDILLGANNQKIKQFSHQNLSTYGIGKELDANTWRSVFRQLVVRGYLMVDVENYGSLKLTESCRSVLNGQQSLQLRKDIFESAGAKSGGKGKKQKIDIEEMDMPLWLKLKACRKRLAEEHNVPAFVVFSDATLKEMLNHHPSNEEEMLAITGVGVTKFERFGEQFLAVLSEVDFG
ncbi:MAG: DNA helicase RecQ [Alteromonadaceae bacterium]|nr:DNA helicase RecQ [Alteromonadaceae bacterium]